MKLNEMALANASAIVAAAFFILCALLIATAPGMYRGMMQSWMHGVDLSRNWSMVGFTGGSLIFGFISFVVISWVTGWVFAKVYNSLAKK